MNAYRTFDARVRVAACVATPSGRLLLLAEDLAVALLSPGRRLGLTRALLFLGAGYDSKVPGDFFLPLAARRVKTPATARASQGLRVRSTLRYAALYGTGPTLEKPTYRGGRR